MGLTTSTPAPQQGRQVVESKMHSACKTGVLNLSSMKLTVKSKVWKQFLDPTALLNMKLKSLDLSMNELITTPIELIQLHELKTLILTNCLLNELDLGHFPQLNKLIINSNLLTENNILSLPASLACCNISNNRLVNIPLAFFGLVTLVELDLSSNRLTDVHGIGHLQYIVLLNLDDNLITTISSDIGLLTKLKCLSLQRNKLRAVNNNTHNKELEPTFPSSLFVNTSVETIMLQGNDELSSRFVLSLDGIDSFLERRKKLKDKNFQGGAIVDFSLFGLD